MYRLPFWSKMTIKGDGVQVYRPRPLWLAAWQDGAEHNPNASLTPRGKTGPKWNISTSRGEFGILQPHEQSVWTWPLSISRLSKKA